MSGKPDWSTLRSLSSALAYGGKIDGAIQDSQIMNSYLEQIFTNDVYTRRWKPLGASLYLPQSNSLKVNEKEIDNNILCLFCHNSNVIIIGTSHCSECTF